MKIKTQFGYYTINDAKRFHSFDEQPAVLVTDHEETDITNGETVFVKGYRAWYNDGELLEVINNE